MSAVDEFKWNNRHDRAILALLQEETTREACRASGTQPSTMARWLRHPVFRERLDRERAEIFAAAKARLMGACSEAIGTLQLVLRDQRAPWTSRVQAARSIVASCIRLNELAAMDKLDRLEGVLGEDDSVTGEVLQ